MAEIFVLGAGLGGTLIAYELVTQLRKGDRITLIGQGNGGTGHPQAEALGVTPKNG